MECEFKKLERCGRSLQPVQGASVNVAVTLRREQLCGEAVQSTRNVVGTLNA